MKPNLNHLGNTRLPYWSEVERSLSPEAKLAVIAHSLSIKPDMGSRPFQTFKSLFRFRNQVGHGKTETVKLTGEKLEMEEIPWPRTDWQQQCEEAQVDRAIEDMQAIIRQLSEASGSKRDPLASPSSGWAHEYQL